MLRVGVGHKGSLRGKEKESETGNIKAQGINMCPCVKTMSVLVCFMHFRELTKGKEEI